MADHLKKIQKLRFEADEDDLNPSATRYGRQVYSVSELSHKIKSLLQDHFDMVWITGEVSNLFQAASGHLYFDLKDANAQIRAVAFRAQAERFTFDLEDGLNLLVMGRISLYEKRGTYQIIVEYAEPAGIGALQKQFEQLKKKLHQEGLFDEKHKQKIPYLPDILGIITSLQGAVIHDIRTTIDSRFQDRHLRVAPVSVQGVKAPQEIADAITLLNDLPDTNLIILARGGGSLEDLNAFNSEIVARAIYDSKIPIISAVGHETDFTIADFTADLRAPTPTAAAEMALPIKSDLQYFLKDRRRNMMSVMHHQIESVRQTIDFISRRLKHPRDQIKQLQLRLKDLINRLFRSTDDRMDHANERLKYSKLRLTRVELFSQLIYLKKKHEMKNNKLLNILEKEYIKNKHRINAQTRALNAYNPTNVLKRGYSITRTFDATPKLVTHSKSVAPSQILEILLARGQLTVEVKKN